MSSLHFRDNLPGEKSYIREALSKKCGLELASNLLPSTPSSLVPSSLTFPSSLATPPPVIKKRRVPSSLTFPSFLAAPPPVVKKHRVPSSLAVPPPVVTKQHSPDIILILSDDENIALTRNPQLPVPTIPSAKCQKQSLPHSPGVVLVLDSEEENGQGRTQLNIHIKQENLLSIKMEDSDDEASTDDMYMSPLRQAQHVRQPSVDTVFLSEDETPKWPQDYYVCNIAKAFKQPPQGLSKKVAFGAYFPGLSFKKSTYYDNYNIWIRTPREFRMKYVDYGRTDKGSWKHFLAARAKYLE
ncbi:hypothetical protein L208DRAFT_845642 [Tricholoma matsutake]|nr:hypothetical protein L208DRAFT_845642 [Tricholoma matsutake 945]